MPASTGQDGRSEDGSAEFPGFGDNIDPATFEQILEMDDDEDERDFSKSIVYDFFTQAEATLKRWTKVLKIETSLISQRWATFSKGSSATLGLTKVKDSCEKIQHFGARMDETGTRDEPNAETSLQNCKRTLQEAKEQFHVAEAALKRFYHDSSAT